jgi:quercetin dioxygenase-like cupin family protein
LPEELEEQAMLHALGILGQDDRRAFAVRLQGESQLLRQAATAYQTATDALAATVAPVAPPTTLRERLVNHVALEARREAEQFELAANTLALGAVPIKPRDAIRQQLLSRIAENMDVRLDIKASAHSLGETHAVDPQSRPLTQAWRHLLVTSYTSLRLCWKALVNLLRTLLTHSGTAVSRTKIGGWQLGRGLIFIKAAEGAWREIEPGVKVKVLSFDMVSRRTTALLRFAPGTSYAPHRHTEVEELFVLQGGCSIAGREMTVGDYHRAEAGTEHYDTSTDEGCLLLVISSPQNEMLR